MPTKFLTGERSRRNVSTPPAQRRALPTVAAAEYLGVSASLLRKLRARRPGDLGSVGPDFVRLGPTLIVYEVAALDRWLDERARESRDGSHLA